MYTVSFLYYRQDFKLLYYKEHDLPTLRNQLGLAIFLFVSSMFLNFIFFSVVYFVLFIFVLCLTYDTNAMLVVSLDCLYLFATSVFSIVYLRYNITIKSQIRSLFKP